MRISIILLTISFLIGFQSDAQTSLVYMRNPATGNLEVYQSQGGLPTGSPLYKIKKNVYGYLEIENVNAQTNPFTQRPDYTPYSNSPSYQLPVREIFETVETLNKRNEYDYMMSKPSNNQQYQSELNNLREYFQNRSRTANAFLKFYSSNISFPKSLKDGWYEVTNITDVSSLSETFRGSAEKDFEFGICKLQNNKVVEYYKNCNLLDLKTGFVFQRKQIDVGGSVSSCKATFREMNSNEYQTIYFLDNILDSTKQIANPNFAFYSIYTAERFDPKPGFVIGISRNREIVQSEIQNATGSPYVTYFGAPNPSTGCSKSLLTLAFKETGNTTDKFSVGILNVTNKKTWIFNNITLVQGDCRGGIISE